MNYKITISGTIEQCRAMQKVADAAFGIFCEIEKDNRELHSEVHKTEERLLVEKYMRKPVSDVIGDKLTTTQIMLKLEKLCGHRLSLHRVGAAIISLGYTKTTARVDGMPPQAVNIVKFKSQDEIDIEAKLNF